MNNAQTTRIFFQVCSSEVKDDILENIARTYGIDCEAVMQEILGDEAEALIDYLTGAVRRATSVLMQAAGLR